MHLLHLMQWGYLFTMYSFLWLCTSNITSSAGSKDETKRQNLIEKERSSEADDSNDDDIEAEEIDKSDPLLEIGINQQEMEGIVEL